jgi:hypothetical protein
MSGAYHDYRASACWNFATRNLHLVARLNLFALADRPAILPRVRTTITPTPKWKEIILAGPEWPLGVEETEHGRHRIKGDESVSISHEQLDPARPGRRSRLRATRSCATTEPATALAGPELNGHKWASNWALTVFARVKAGEGRL